MLPVKTRALLGRFAHFARADSGSVSVEFVLWLPLLLSVIAITADASLAFGSRSTILRVIQDTNRAVSIGKITDMQKAEDAITAALVNIAPHAVVSTTVTEGLISSVVTVPISDLTTLGLISKIQNFELTVASQHLSEG